MFRKHTSAVLFQNSHTLLRLISKNHWHQLEKILCEHMLSVKYKALQWLKFVFWIFCAWFFFVSFLTIFPRCCAERVSRRVKTLPQTEISLQTPGLESWVKPFRGCITSTPFVVNPSICPSDVFHLAAFSWAKQKHGKVSTVCGQFKCPEPNICNTYSISWRTYTFYIISGILLFILEYQLSQHSTPNNSTGSKTQNRKERE